MSNEKTYIAYYRVSTKEQGKSGLGLDAQRSAVERFTNCTDCVIAEYTDVASGKDNKRPQLLLAIDHAKRVGAKLLIAKLDRLSRNAAFIFTLKDSHVDFVCCDMPDANTLTIGIFATMAQYERELISKRTKAALDAKRELIGEWRVNTITDEKRELAIAAIQLKAATNEHNRRAQGYVIALRSQGLSLSQIAERLNSEGFKTARGKQFQRTTVKRLIEKAA